MTAIRINPNKRFGNIPELDGWIARDSKGTDPSKRYRVNGTHYHNLTTARQAVMTWKQIDIRKDIHKVVEYVPGTWALLRNPGLTTGEHPMQDSTNETTGELSAEEQAIIAKKAAKKASNERQRAKKMANQKARDVYHAKKAERETTTTEQHSQPQSIVSSDTPRYQVTLGDKIRINVNTVDDLDAVFMLAKKHQM